MFCETGGMLDGQLRGVGVRGCMGGFFIFVGQALFYEKGVSLVFVSWRVVPVIGMLSR